MGVLDRAISLSLPVVPKPLVRLFSKPYIAGSTVDDAITAVRHLADEGAMSTLDILGEFISTDTEAEANTQAYVELVQRIRADQIPEANISVKLSALGLLLRQDVCLEHMRRLTAEVEAAKSFIRIDMEDSPCTDATLEIYRQLREEFGPTVGVVLQARLHRTADDISALTQQPANFRLCKGIYLEPEEVAQTEFQPIRDAFVSQLEQMFLAKSYVGIATHDEWLVDRAVELIERHQLKHHEYEFQMLLGVLPTLRRRVIAAGHRLRVYVPFGANWYAYSVRRLRENPEIAGHVLKGLFRRS
jgi:proline dehydrogenase